ncbi:hypothetical protein ACR6C2_40955 [Streptomyces sp. INA 01156]
MADVVEEAAPEEKLVLAALAHVDDAQVLRAFRRQERRETEQLGFGLAELTAVVTPIVWVAVDEACRTAVQSSVEAARGRIAGAARRLFRRQSAPAAETEVPELSREQLALVHHRVLEDARSAGIEEQAATALADRVVARLILAARADGGPEEGTERRCESCGPGRAPAARARRRGPVRPARSACRNDPAVRAPRHRRVHGFPGDVQHRRRRAPRTRRGGTRLLVRDR